jgi:hypothetical protein
LFFIIKKAKAVPLLVLGFGLTAGGGALPARVARRGGPS